MTDFGFPIIKWPDGRPIPDALTVSVQVATSRRPDANNMAYIFADTGHRRVTIEGKQDDVQRFIDVIAPVLQEFKDEYA